jgi:hypothetical protein
MIFNDFCHAGCPGRKEGKGLGHNCEENCAGAPLYLHHALSALDEGCPTS